MRKIVGGLVLATSVGLIPSAAYGDVVMNSHDGGDCETSEVWTMVEDYSFVTEDGRTISVGHIEVSYEQVCVSDALPIDDDE